MKTVTMHEAKTHLSRLVKELRDGKEPEIIIAIGDTPAACLTAYNNRSGRILGSEAGLIEISEDFDSIDEEIADLFEGKTSGKRSRK